MSLLGALLLAASGALASPPARIGVKDAGGCSPEQRAAVDEAKPEARKRAAAAQALVAKADGGSDAAARKKVEGYFTLVDFAFDAGQLKGFAGSLGKIAETIDKAEYQCAAKTDKNCGARAGYVNRADGAVIVHLCPMFFKDSASSRANTLVHEAAHLLDDRIGDRDDSGAQCYCGMFDCEMRCSDGPTADGRKRPYFIADNWAHFVYCASGQPPQIDVITASPKK